MKKKKKQDQGAKMVLPGWFASYADMVTVLMVFFILLFTMSLVDEAKFEELLAGFRGERTGTGGGESIFEQPSIFPHPDAPLDIVEPIPTPNIEGEIPVDVEYTPGEIAAHMANSFRTYLAPYIVAQQNENMTTGVDVIIDIPEHARYLRLIMPDRALFASGQAQLMPSAIALLDHMAPEIMNYAEQGHRIVIEGHADNIPLPIGSMFIDNWGLSGQRASAVVRHLVNNWDIPPYMIESRAMGEHHPVDTNDTAEGRANNRRVEIKIYTEVDISSMTNVNRPSSTLVIPGL
jgi:chemotaxis protein MotB